MQTHHENQEQAFGDLTQFPSKMNINNMLHTNTMHHNASQCIAISLPWEMVIFMHASSLLPHLLCLINWIGQEAEEPGATTRNVVVAGIRIQDVSLVWTACMADVDCMTRWEGLVMNMDGMQGWSVTYNGTVFTVIYRMDSSEDLLSSFWTSFTEVPITVY